MLQVEGLVLRTLPGEGAKKVGFLALSVALSDDNVLESDIVLKPIELRNVFDIV